MRFVNEIRRGRPYRETSQETQLQLSIIAENRRIEGVGISSRPCVIVRRQGTIVRKIEN